MSRRKRPKDERPVFTTDRIPLPAPEAPTTERIDVSRELSSRRLGMWLFLASLGMLFAAALVGFLVVRLRAAEWPPPGSPELPAGLWLSTAILAVQSLVLVVAERAARSGANERLWRMLGGSLVLAVAFLGSQVANWMRMAATYDAAQQSLFTFGFYLLTVLHALHVVGGLVPLVLVVYRARGGRYTPDDYEGVHLVAMYWHFLALAWVAILAVLSF
jgi:cytochrome c oxidase subunit 3